MRPRPPLFLSLLLAPVALAAAPAAAQAPARIDDVEAVSLLAPNADPVTVATQGYGVANWHLYNGRPEEAEALFRKILEGESWAAFGRIAAPAELATTGGIRR